MEPGMNMLRLIRLAGLALLLSAGRLAAESGHEEPFTPLEAHTAATVAKQPNAAVYALLINVEVNDRLVGAEADVCERVDLVNAHDEVLPYTDLALEEDVIAVLGDEPFHLRLTGLRRALLKGETVIVTLVFENSGRVQMPTVVN
jgi:copper(I)-binding protein